MPSLCTWKEVSGYYIVLIVFKSLVLSLFGKLIALLLDLKLILFHYSVHNDFITVLNKINL